MACYASNVAASLFAFLKRLLLFACCVLFSHFSSLKMKTKTFPLSGRWQFGLSAWRTSDTHKRLPYRFVCRCWTLTQPTKERNWHGRQSHISVSYKCTSDSNCVKKIIMVVKCMIHGFSDLYKWRKCNITWTNSCRITLKNRILTVAKYRLFFQFCFQEEIFFSKTHRFWYY